MDNQPQQNETIQKIAAAVKEELKKNNLIVTNEKPLKITRSILSIATVWAILVFFFVVVLNETLMDLDNKEVLMFILGALVTLLTMIFSFYFKEKD